MVVGGKKRVALTTWYGYHNYGTALQVVSLYGTLSRLGCDVAVVDYNPSGRYVHRPEFKGALDIYKGIAKRGIDRPRGATYAPEARSRLFEEFLHERLKFTKPCPTKAELEGLNDFYDVFVCGSDQIWAPSVFDPHYFLDFVGADRLKVAYAPSVGLPSVDDQDVARQMTRLCSSFDALSTREESGSRIVAGLTGRHVATVIDPTLLVSAGEWRKEAAASSIIADGAPYLLAYMLGQNEIQWKRVYALGKRLGLVVRVIPVFEKDIGRDGCIVEPIGPREFVSLVANASYVCTDSFHGVAFSANLERDFCVFERFREGDETSQNSRVYNILEKLGLYDRLAAVGVPDDELARPIDWKESRERLRAERSTSLAWLKTALEMEPRVSGLMDNIKHDRTLCCGCAACEVICPANAISIKLDGEGFWRACVDKNVCISCGKCRKVCPFIECEASRPVTGGELYSYKCDDKDQLLESSSGGAGAAIARKASEMGEAVLGCSFIKGEGAVGKFVKPVDEKGLASLAGSKYMQSRVGNALAEAAAHEGPFFVTGTPCQVAAARNLFGWRDDVTYVDVVCHGVPSRYLYERYLEWLKCEYEINSNEVLTIFRYKPNGWRERYILSTDGKHEVCLYQRKDPYLLMFEVGQCYGGCCYECPWRATSAADVRMADYWGPRFKDDKSGVSMLLTMTERGREVVWDLADTGKIEKQPLDDYMRYQQTTNVPEPVFRDEVIKKLAIPGADIRAICDEFAEPVAKSRDAMRKLDLLRPIAKRLLRRR